MLSSSIMIIKLLMLLYMIGKEVSAILHLMRVSTGVEAVLCNIMG